MEKPEKPRCGVEGCVEVCASWYGRDGVQHFKGGCWRHWERMEVVGKREKRCGIYYLVDYVEDGVVVLYVGASKDVGERIRRHQRDGSIKFCDVFFDPCEESELEEREARAIAEFRPVLFGKNMPR